MTGAIILGLLIPFAGTGLGAAMVFFFSKQISDNLFRKEWQSALFMQAGFPVMQAYHKQQR